MHSNIHVQYRYMQKHGCISVQTHEHAEIHSSALTEHVINEYHNTDWGVT